MIEFNYSNKNIHSFKPPTEGCGADVGCYRHPPECRPDQCEFLITFKPEGDVIEFNISVSVTNDNMRWAAVGFSTDIDMVMVF